MFSMVLPCDPKILFLGVFPRKMKTYVYKNVCRVIFTVVVFTTMAKEEQTKYSATVESVSKI